MKFKIGEIVWVRWLDSYRESGPVWEEWNQGQEPSSHCESVGWVTKIGKLYVTVSGHTHTCENAKYCSGCMSIPLPSIVKVKHIA
jgi:uncharacterized protein (DUF169 family)